MKKKIVKLFSLFLMLLFIQSCTKSDATIYGTWKLDKKKSTDVVTWRYRNLEMEISKKELDLTLIKNWNHRRSGNWSDTLTFTPGAEPNKIRVNSPIWQENWYMGVLSKTNVDRKASGQWEEPDKKLKMMTEQIVEISQGETTVKTTSLFSVNRKGNILTVIEKRSSRPSEIKLVFEKVVVE
jgi:hypothetical protein